MSALNIKKPLIDEEWLIVLLGFFILALIIVAPSLMNNINMLSVSSLGASSGWINNAYTFIFLMVIVYLSAFLSRKPVKGILMSFLMIFVLTMLAQLCASIPFSKKYGLESVLYAVLLGLLISNIFRVPNWLRPAIQSEFYIKIGIICLGATVIFSEIMKSGAFGLAQALIVVLCVWYFGFWVARKVFHVDDEMATMLASSVSICGVSAAIATCGTIKGDQKKLSYVISLVMVVAIPMLYLMPLLCNWILPMLFDNPTAIAQVAGAWIGGTIDTTAAVAASGGILGPEAGETAVIVKASQNVLIGVAALLISIFWSVRNTQDVEKLSGRVIWQRFPKFVVGMVIASVAFSLWFSGGVEIGENVVKFKALAKNFQGILFSIAFVCIGLETRLGEIFSKENRQSLKAFLTAQTFNVVFTLIVASVLFGVLAN